MGAIFDIPTGQRVKLTTETVNIVHTDLGTKGMLKTNVTYEATATDEHMDDNGTRRRLFTDTSIDFAGNHQIWLSDGGTSGEGEYFCSHRGVQTPNINDLCKMCRDNIDRWPKDRIDTSNVTMVDLANWDEPDWPDFIEKDARM